MTDMNAIVSNFAAAQRAVAVPAEQWSAWRLGERESDAAKLDAPETVDEAVRQAMASLPFDRGDTLAVLYEHAGRNRRTLWLYAIKRSTRHGTYRPALDGGRSVFVGRLEPHLICETAVEAFAPVPRFDAFRDDPVGRDLTLVEGRAQ